MQEVARNALILGVLLYGCEAWALLKGDQDKMERFQIVCRARTVTGELG
jgi:hypothetical protein